MRKKDSWVLLMLVRMIAYGDSANGPFVSANPAVPPLGQLTFSPLMKVLKLALTVDLIRSSPFASDPINIYSEITPFSSPQRAFLHCLTFIDGGNSPVSIPY